MVNISKDVSKIHEYKATLHEDYFVPPHEPRTPSKGFIAIRKQLIKIEDSPCAICGIKNSELKDLSINKIGAKQIELHHKVIEWAWHTVADQTKVSKDYPIVKDMTNQEFLDWLDHGREVILILCDLHHRHREVGIHEISGPSFNLVDYIKDDFNLEVDQNV